MAQRFGRGLAAALIGCIAGAAPSPAFATDEPKELAEIASDLRAGRVAEAEKLCSVLPRRMYDVTARLPYGTSRPPQPGLYADLFARCAVVALRNGDAAAASWRWHSAHAFDSRIAASTVIALGAFGEMPVVRRLGEGIPGAALAAREKGSAVKLGYDGTAPRLLPGAEIPGLSLRGGFKCGVGLELVIGTDGRPREPAVEFHEKCVPVQVLVILDSLADWRFEPARSGAGEPIEVAYFLTLNAPPRDKRLDQLGALLSRQPAPPPPTRPPG